MKAQLLTLTLLAASITPGVEPQVKEGPAKDLDVRKRVIEEPIERSLQTRLPELQNVLKQKLNIQPQQAVPRMAAGGEADRRNNRPRTIVNPKVKPGKVAWHDNFEAACEAARSSGRPVLLFQLLGNLDDQFC